MFRRLSRRPRLGMQLLRRQVTPMFEPNIVSTHTPSCSESVIKTKRNIMCGFDAPSLGVAVLPRAPSEKAP